MKLEKPFVLWFTGLSASGKTTLAEAVNKFLTSNDLHRVELIDGDVIRTNLSKGLGFSREDRDINIRRVGWVAQKLYSHDVSVIVSVISPYSSVRSEVREMIGKGFIEIFMNCPIDICEQRDPKGLYKKARLGEIKGFTGIDDPYEMPLNPELEINSSQMSVSGEVEKIISFLKEREHLI